jgi:hypothetical protein
VANNLIARRRDDSTGHRGAIQGRTGCSRLTRGSEAQVIHGRVRRRNA